MGISRGTLVARCRSWYTLRSMSHRLPLVPLALLAVLAVLAAAPSHAAARRPLVASWAMAPNDPGTLASLVPHHDDLGGRTVRDIVRVTLGGSALRIRVSNLLGTRPLTIDDARVARSAGGAATSGPGRRLTFGGRGRITIPAGRQVVSDVTAFEVQAEQDLAVSVHGAGVTGTVTAGGSLFHTTYLSPPGDAAASTSAARFPDTAKVWY